MPADTYPLPQLLFNFKKLGLQRIRCHTKEVCLSYLSSSINLSFIHSPIHHPSTQTIHSKGDLTWPEKLMAHGVDSDNVIRAYITIINGWLWFRGPVGIILVCMCANFSQQLKFQGFGLIVPSGEDTKTNICLGEKTTKVRQSHRWWGRTSGSTETKGVSTWGEG